MKPRTRKSIAKRVHELQAILDMRDWTFVLDGAPPPESERLAEVSVVTGSRVGRIAVSADLLKMPDDAVTYVLVHELLHAYLWAMGEHHTKLTELIQSKEAGAMARDAYEDIEERTVDALALAITALIRPGAKTRLQAVTPIAALYWRE